MINHPFLFLRILDIKIRCEVSESIIRDLMKFFGRTLKTSKLFTKRLWKTAEKLRKTIENLEIGEKIFGRHPADVDSLFTNISSQETIKICTNELFKESETVKGLSKSEFKDLLSLPTNYSDFIFNGTLYKQIDGMTMSFLLGCTLANALYAYHEKIDQNVFHMNIDHFTIGDTLLCWHWRYFGM